MYQADPIQSMINELDRVLHRTGRWRLWNLFTQLYDQRQMLERVRSFLLMQQRSDHRTAPPELSPIAPYPAPALIRPLPPPHLHPDSVKLEVAALIAQRDALREEVKFLSVLTQTSDQKIPLLAPPSAPDTRQIEQLSALHDRTDFLLSSMDSSLQLAFNSMQKNVEVYQTTLHQGLDRMHNLGYQGEVLFSALINHLAQQMGRELAANPTTNSTTALPDDLWSILDRSAVPQDAPSITPIQSPFSTLTAEATPETLKTAETLPTSVRSNPQTHMDPSTPKKQRLIPETKPAAEPRPETAVRFSPETAISDREMTLDTLFGNPFGNPFDNTSNDSLSNTFDDSLSDTLGNLLGDFGGSSSDSVLKDSLISSDANSNFEVSDDITLEEMNTLFTDIPSLRS